MTTILRLLPLLVMLVAGCASRQTAATDEVFTIEFKLATAAPRPGAIEMVPLGSDRPIWVYPEVVITRADIAYAERAKDNLGYPAILLEMTDDGAARLLAVSTKHIDQPLALFVDGALISAPYVRSQLSKRMMIIGSPTGIEKEVAKRVVERINAG